MNIAVVIPVYKNPDKYEMTSLQQCCKVLGNYLTTLVVPDSFDTCEYQLLWQSHGLNLQEERFDDFYFSDIHGYNRLMLSREFYARFQAYDYILIYQSDAYVFVDQLLDWCKKGYDYVGAPLVGHFEETVYHSAMPMRVGNGGFSLRRVQAFLDYFEGKRNVFTAKQIAERISLWKKPYTRVFVWLLMMMGWKNKPLSLAESWLYNEDDFWSGLLDGTRYAMLKPSPQEALLFSFERFPKEMYEITNQLPFGCHAWLKYQYEEFWNQYFRRN